MRLPIHWYDTWHSPVLTRIWESVDATEWCCGSCRLYWSCQKPSAKLYLALDNLGMARNRGEVGSLPSHQLLWFLACITSTRDLNPDLPAPRPVALPLGHRVGASDTNCFHSMNLVTNEMWCYQHEMWCVPTWYCQVHLPEVWYYTGATCVILSCLSYILIIVKPV